MSNPSAPRVIVSWRTTAFRSSAPEIEVCAELGLAFLPWSPLGGLNSAKGLGDEHLERRKVDRVGPGYGSGRIVLPAHYKLHSISDCDYRGIKLREQAG